MGGSNELHLYADESGVGFRMRVYDKGLTIIGPPGTGKTSKLIKLVREALDNGCPPDQIGYISFTKAAVKEAKSRIIRNTGIPSERFQGFRTLHSMVYWISGLSSGSILSDKDIRNVLNQSDGKLYRGAESDSLTHFVSMMNFARVSGMKLSQVYECMGASRQETEADFLDFVLAYRKYKKATNKMDFIDIIVNYVLAGRPFPFKYLFVDEAQDFTPDQWQAVQRLAETADTVYIAGDADQAIYEWAGVQVSMFDNLEGPRQILDQSHRVPREPHKVASNILGLLGRKILYRPLEKEGSVRQILPCVLPTLPYLNGETWFILARNNHHLKEIFAMLRSLDVYASPLRVSGQTGQEMDAEQDPHLKLILLYNRALLGKEPKKISLQRLNDACDNRFEDCVAEKLPWYRAFFGWPLERLAFYRRTEQQWKEKKVRVGTFHSSKGAEADNVILLGDMVRRCQDRLAAYEPEELRALYVAVTRTKNNLYLVEPEGESGAIWSTFTKPNQDHTRNLL